MIEGSCLCGNVKLTISGAIQRLVACNCTACGRYGALWAHADASRIAVAAALPTIGFSRGEKSLVFHHCPICGCLTHYVSINPDYPDKMAMNMRMADPTAIATIPVRHFDGRDTWKFLD